MKCIPNDVFFAWVESEIAEGHSVRFRLKGQSMFRCCVMSVMRWCFILVMRTNCMRWMWCFSVIKGGMYCIGFYAGKGNGCICKETDLM